MNSALENEPTKDLRRQSMQALSLWGVFIALAVIMNGTIPFILGFDLHKWTYSPLKDVAFNLILYGGLFLVVPLVLTKGWATVRRPAFFLPLIIAVLAMTLRTFFRPTAALAVIILIYLHWRFDLSKLGIQSRGWKGDIIAILLFGLIYLAPSLLQSNPMLSAPGNAFLASLDRLFLNPASTTEYLFYFGFLAERLSHQTGKWMTPLIIAAMYTTHEMSNPEYWYEGSKFLLIFIGVALTTSIFLWRRSIVVIWLGDGLGRFVSRLFTGAV
ncbi:MAG: hypothetical protein NTW38_06360 [Candidatus Aminicenantes bacterium]|nr:hypothetical protein [Candidatus Aminicenantes bacterium]